MSIRSFTIYDIFQRNADIYGANIGLVEDDQRVTFQQLFERVNALTAGLARQGITKGDRIAILAHNSHRFIYLFGAAAALGAVVVPINWRLSGEEIAYILQDAAPKALAATHHHQERVAALAADGTAPEQIWGLDGPLGEAPFIETLMADAPPPSIDVIGEDPFCIIYTAAVEGRPRGAVLSHSNIVFGNIQTIATMGLTHQDAYLNMLPLFHITGLNLCMSVMHCGGKNVVIEKFDPTMVLKQTEKNWISVWGSFPPILSRLVDALDTGSYDLSSVRHVMGIDGPDTIKAFEKKTAGTFWMLYGQTETSGNVTLSPALEKPGSAGRQTLISKMKLVDDAENEVMPGEKGEIAVQGPLVFQGFWNQEELTRRTFRRGWHHTGDMGRLDDDGYLWFEGRKPEKELIKPGGENVYPAEVEQVILSHAAVAEVSVIGVPDPEFGEGIKAVCVLKPGRTLSAAELTEFVAARIARYKKPRYVAFVEGLPKKANGSIDRDQVKALYAKG